jgi:predicted metal-dependent phosphoesterase TrpH
LNPEPQVGTPVRAMIAAAMENVDLHCHSRASDGLLAPAEIVLRAQAHGVTTLALTDHDDTSGLQEATDAAYEAHMRFVQGVEISVTWNDTTIHVVGLGIDPEDPALEQGLKWVRGGRTRRAALIAASLADAGIPGSLEGAMAYVQNPDLISRTHFARFLVERGYASGVGSVFKNYMVHGKPGFVPHMWAALGDAIRWIRGAGGIAVLAHPARYRFTHNELHRFLAEFSDHGGLGIEVMTPNHTREECAAYAALAREFGMLASRGSDFHGPGESRIELGAIAQLPDGLRPVWQAL